MHEQISKVSLEDAGSEDVYTDTSMFSAEEIVKNIEAVAAEKKKVARKALDRDGKRRLELLREEQRLQKDLEDFDDLDF